jgi:hypothetical protein
MEGIMDIIKQLSTQYQGDGEGYALAMALHKELIGEALNEQELEALLNWEANCERV